MTALLEVDDLSVQFNRKGVAPFTAVDKVSFTVAPGQTVGLVGESGLRQVGDLTGDHATAAQAGLDDHRHGRISRAPICCPCRWMRCGTAVAATWR